MTNFLTTHNFNKQSLIFGAGVIALAAFLTFGVSLLSAPQPAAAQSGCYPVNIGGLAIRADADQDMNGTGNDTSETTSETQIIIFSDYTNSGEYVDSIAVSTWLDGYAAGDCGPCNVVANIGMGSESSGFSESFSFDYDNNEAVTVSEVIERDVDNLDQIHIDYYAYAYSAAKDGWATYTDVDVETEVTNIELTICDSAGNIPPVANNDGSEDAPMSADDDSVTAMVVLNNDEDEDNGPDPLSIVSAYTDSSQSSVSISGDELVYNPNGLSPGSDDLINYTITDGADIDDALVYVSVAGAIGDVTLDTEIAGDASFTAMYENKDGTEVISLGLEGDEPVTLWFTLYEEPGLFSIPYDSVSYDDDTVPPEDEPWVKKEVIYEKTFNEWSAELGLSYTDDEPIAPDPNQPPVASVAVSEEGIDSAEKYLEFDGTGSSDPDGDPLTYQWEYLGNDYSGYAPASIDSPESSITDATVLNPHSDLEVNYDFRLTVSDGDLSDSVTFTVSHTCQEPYDGAAQCLEE